MTQKTKTARAARKGWKKPELTRLNAGMAENLAVGLFDGIGLPGTNLS
ncbi:MAG: hypothetical protein ACXWUX_12015 [Allosphingosinicella sp.]